MTERSKELPIAGEVFCVAGQTAFLISPPDDKRRAPTPWVWYAPTLPGLPGPEEEWMFRRFLDAGIAIAGMDVGESFGSPQGSALFTALYEELVERRGFSPKPCLLGRSRGGLMLYGWAVANPARVGCVAGIYPVCNLLSYPGVAKACAAYDLTEAEFAATLPQHNPIDRLEPLAKAGVAIFHIHGDADTVVPLEENSGEVARRYRQFGGEMTLLVCPGRGHDMWPGWFQCGELVDFVIAHTRAT